MKLSTSILLIEKDPDNRHLFTEALDEIENASLYTIVDNEEMAMEQLKKASVLPDLIFTDIQKPLRDGISSLSAIIKNPITKDIPIVILSDTTTESQFAFDLGVRAYIKKSHNSKTLRAQLDEMINLYFMDNCERASQTFNSLLTSA